MGNLCAEVFKGNSRTLNVMRGMTPRKFSKSEKNRNQPLLTRQAAQQPSSPSTLHLACLGRVFRRGLAVGPSSAAPRSLRSASSPRLLAPAPVSFVACFPPQALRFASGCSGSGPQRRALFIIELLWVGFVCLRVQVRCSVRVSVQRGAVTWRCGPAPARVSCVASASDISTFTF